MPIRVQNDLPVKEILEHENIICNGRIPGSTSGYPSDQDRAFKSDAVKGGYRAADTAVSLEHTASGGCCICPCIRTCIEKYIHQSSA